MTPLTLLIRLLGAISLAVGLFALVMGIASIDAFSPDRLGGRVVSILRLASGMLVPFFLIGASHVALGISLLAPSVPSSFVLGSYAASLVAWALAPFWTRIFLLDFSSTGGGPDGVGGAGLAILIFLGFWVLYAIYFAGFILVCWIESVRRSTENPKRVLSVGSVLLSMVAIIVLGIVSDITALEVRKKLYAQYRFEYEAAERQRVLKRIEITRRIEKGDSRVSDAEFFSLSEADILPLLADEGETMLSTLRNLDRGVIKDELVKDRLIEIFLNPAHSKEVRMQSLVLIVGRLAVGNGSIDEDNEFLDKIANVIRNHPEFQQALGRVLDMAMNEEGIPLKVAAPLVSLLGPDALPILPQLIRSLSHRDTYEFVPSIVEAIGSMGPAAKNALPALQKIWEDLHPTSEQRPRLEAALKQILNEESTASILSDSQDEVRFAALKILRSRLFPITGDAAQAVFQTLYDATLPKPIRLEALFVIASRDLLESNKEQIHQVESLVRSDREFLNVLGIVVNDSRGFFQSNVQYSPIQTALLIRSLGEEASPILQQLCNCLDHQDQENYVPLIIEAILNVGPKAVPTLEGYRQGAMPEVRRRWIDEILTKLQSSASSNDAP